LAKISGTIADWPWLALVKQEAITFGSNVCAFSFRKPPLNVMYTKGVWIMQRFVIVLWLTMASVVHAQESPRLGIFGTVSSVDPLVVAGERIEKPEAVGVISPLGPKQSIALGDTFAIRAELRAGKLEAERMLAIYPIAGPVRAVEGQLADIMGTKIHIPPSESMKKNLWYAVSGLWSGDTIITTNLRRLDGSGFAHLTGVLAGDETRQIGSSTVTGVPLSEVNSGTDIWLLSGTPKAKSLAVRLSSKGLFGGAVDLALWEGYASLPVASQTYAIYGTGITGSESDAQMPEAGELIRRCVKDNRTVKSPPDGLHTAFIVLGCARHTRVD